jgi:FkbM family methyltransferase
VTSPRELARSARALAGDVRAQVRREGRAPSRAELTDLVRIQAVDGAATGLRSVSLSLGTQFFYTRSDLHLLYREVVLHEGYRPARSVRTDPLIVDAGANIGLATLWFARTWPAARVLAFEPSPDACAAVERTVEANDLGGVTLHPAALTADGRTVHLSQSADRPASPTAAIRSDGEVADSEVAVDSLRLSDVLADEERIDLLKLDVEGSEHEVVEDLRAAGTLGRIDNVVAEVTSGRHRPPIGPTITALEEAGLVVQVEGVRRAGRSRQDLLLVAFRPAG